MKPKIYIFTENNGKVSIDTEELKRVLDEFYQRGYDDGCEGERLLNRISGIDLTRKSIKTITREDVDKVWNSLYDSSKWKHRKD